MRWYEYSLQDVWWRMTGWYHHVVYTLWPRTCVEPQGNAMCRVPELCYFVGGPLDGQYRPVPPEHEWYILDQIGVTTPIQHIYTRQATQPHRFLYYEDEGFPASRGSLAVSSEESSV